MALLYDKVAAVLAWESCKYIIIYNEFQLLYQQQLTWGVCV